MCTFEKSDCDIKDVFCVEIGIYITLLTPCMSTMCPMSVQLRKQATSASASPCSACKQAQDIGMKENQQSHFLWITNKNLYFHDWVSSVFSLRGLLS